MENGFNPLFNENGSKQRTLSETTIEIIKSTDEYSNLNSNQEANQNVTLQVQLRNMKDSISTNELRKSNLQISIKV